jgi:carbon starvation protein
LLVVTLYLKSKGGKKFLVVGLPCLIMLVVTNTAMVKNEIIFLTSEKYAGEKWLLSTIGAGIFVLALWMTIEALIAFGLRRPIHSRRQAGS